jgi:predicted nucleic acid-binding protein
MATPSARPGSALDSNVLNALLHREPQAAQVAAVLGQLQRTHALVICPVVYAELLAGPGATVPILQGLSMG